MGKLRVLSGSEVCRILAENGFVTARRSAYAYDCIDTHGKDLHGQPLGQYVTHGLSHHVGLDAHDAFDPAEALKTGMVITIEPGACIPEENIGIRIEDIILLTETGAKVLSGALPTDPDQIERAMAHRN